MLRGSAFDSGAAVHGINDGTAQASRFAASHTVGAGDEPQSDGNQIGEPAVFDSTQTAGVADLFGRVVPASFMSIFARATTASLYWRILSRLYLVNFESDRLRILKDDAIDLIRATWVQYRLASAAKGEDSPDVVEPDQDDLVERSLIAVAAEELDYDLAVARYLLARCVRTGWIHLEFQRDFNTDAVHFTPTAARPLDVWIREARDEQPPLQGYLLNIRTMLASQALEEKPSVALATARRAMRDFARELVVLSQDIARSIDRVLQEAATPQAVLHEAMERYGKRVSGNYHRIKTVENIHRVRAELLHRIDSLSADVDFVERAAAAWVEHDSGSTNQGRGFVMETLHAMRETLGFLPTLLSDLDERNSKFSGAAFRQLVYLLHQDAQLEGKLEQALRQLSILDHASGDSVLPIEVYRFRGLAHHSAEADPGLSVAEANALSEPDLTANAVTAVGSVSFLYRQPAAAIPMVREPVAAGSAELTVDAAEQLAQRLANALTPRQLDAMTRSLLGHHATVHVREISMTTIREFVRAVVVIAWAQRDQGISHFERLSCHPTSPNTICGNLSCPQCRHRSGPYVVPNGVIVLNRPRRANVSASLGDD